MAYLLLAMPLSLFFYLETTPEAESFFAGYPDRWWLRSTMAPLVLAALAGTGMLWRLPVRGRKWMGAGWLAFVAGLCLLHRSEGPAWDLVAAFGLCVPGWIGVTVWLRQLWQRADKPVGAARDWAQNGLLLAAAMILSFAANAVFILAAFPQLNASPVQRVLLAGRVGGLAGTAVLVFLPLLVMLSRLLGTKRGGSRAMLLSIGLLLESAMMLILLNGLRFIGGIFIGFSSCCYAALLTMPAVVLFCRRAALCEQGLAESLLRYGRLAARNSSRHGLASSAAWLLLLAGTFWLAGQAHLYYEWGFATAAFYSALSVGCAWYLLSMLPRERQTWLIRVSLAGAALGLITLFPLSNLGGPWNTYLKFDKNFGSLVHAYYNRYPRNEPEFRRARQLLEASHSRVERDLTQVRRQELLLQPQSRRPNVFFIVADALRGETYGASAEERGRFPGVAWMVPRFAVYENAWTTYNSTRGSYPAYLNGRVQPAWYRYFWSYPVRQDNVLARACALAGYRCYNFATFSEDFSPCWPTNTWVGIHSGGVGLGDPGIVFPQALETLDAHRAETPNQPAFFYLHLFNMHQPMFRRAGIPLERQGLYFMRGLYEQNVAYFDAQLLAFLRGLEQRGLMANSTIVVTADHGEELFELGGVYHGWQINPWVMHVPLFIHYPACAPAAPPPAILSRPVNLIDLAPTICQTMGAKIARNSSWQGLSLLDPEPAEARSFLLLSWKNPLVGQISFSPLRMQVLDLNSGEEQVFTPARQGWNLSAGTLPPALLAGRINQGLAGLFDYWQMAH